MPQGCPGGDWGWSRDGGRCWGCCGVSRGKRGKAGPGGMSKDSLAHTLRLYQKVIQAGSPDNVPTPLQIGKWGKGQNQRREPSWASQPVIIQFFIHQQIFIELLLFARHCSGRGGYGSDQGGSSRICPLLPTLLPSPANLRATSSLVFLLPVLPNCPHPKPEGACEHLSQIRVLLG